MLSVVARSAGASREKPAEPVRRDSCRLPWAWDGLCFALPMLEPGPEGLRCVVTGAVPSSITGTIGWEKDHRGNTVAGMGTGTWVDYDFHPRHNLPTTALTIIVRVKRRGAGEDSGTLICNRYALTNPYTSWSLVDDPVHGGELLGGIADSASSFILTPQMIVSMPTAEYAMALLRWESGSTINIDALSERGILLQSTGIGSSSVGPIAYSGTGGIRINGSEQTDPDNFDALYSQILVWSRRLTNVEARNLCVDPFGWYSPRRETITVAAPFPVGPGMAAQGMVYGGQ